MGGVLGVRHASGSRKKADRISRVLGSLSSRMIRRSATPPSSRVEGWDVLLFHRSGSWLCRWKGLDSFVAWRTRPPRKELGKGKFRAAKSAVATESDYLSRVRLALRAHAAGELYQANLSQSFEASWRGQISSLYETLMRRNPGPFMGLFQGRGFTVASSSPERLFSLREGRLEARPIAGTRPRGRNRRETARWRRQLRASPKERAEHLMLVDLARNDLGRVARYGSVRVDDFARVETYAKVQHLVSTVEGRLRPTSPSRFGSTRSSGGTITGVRNTLHAGLDGLETRPRGFYTGAMGYLAPGPPPPTSYLDPVHDAGGVACWNSTRGAGSWRIPSRTRVSRDLHKVEL
jgi:anthranilate/para-aminobenzoate synthase component I